MMCSDSQGLGCSVKFVGLFGGPLILAGYGRFFLLLPPLGHKPPPLPVTSQSNGLKPLVVVISGSLRTWT